MRHLQIWVGSMLVGLLIGHVSWVHAASSSQSVGVRIIIPNREPAPVPGDLASDRDDAVVESDRALFEPVHPRPETSMEQSTTLLRDGDRTIILHTRIERL